jgi:butyryl-CoA dehydrogenase
MLFVMNELANLHAVSQLPGCEDATPETAEAVLEESAKFVAGEIAPLNHAATRSRATGPRTV